MPYRDDREALRLRNAELEEQLGASSAAIARLRRTERRQTRAVAWAIGGCALGAFVAASAGSSAPTRTRGARGAEVTTPPPIGHVVERFGHAQLQPVEGLRHRSAFPDAPGWWKSLSRRSPSESAGLGRRRQTKPHPRDGRPPRRPNVGSASRIRRRRSRSSLARWGRGPARGSGSARRPRTRRIFLATAGSMMVAMGRSLPSQVGHARASIPWVRRRRTARRGVPMRRRGRRRGDPSA